MDVTMALPATHNLIHENVAYISLFNNNNNNIKHYAACYHRSFLNILIIWIYVCVHRQWDLVGAYFSFL